MEYSVINLEEGMPTVEQALHKLRFFLRVTKSSRDTVVKIIHGYGSTGKGGKIKTAVHMQLAREMRANNIRAFVCGENFSPFDAATRKILDRYPTLARDKDYARNNPGVTIVWRN